MSDSVTDSRNPVPASGDVRTKEIQTPRQLTVVVPCHNEIAAIPNLCEAVMRLQSATEDRYQLEWIFVDDGSTDETAACLQQHFGDSQNATVLRHEANRGIAAAIATGLRHAQGEIVASIDADCTYDPLSLLPMLELLSDDVDLVVASPYHPQGAVADVPAWRLGLSRMASRLYRVVLRNKLHTYTSCVRVYRRSSVVDLPVRNGGFVGVVELVWQLDRRGGKIVEHPAVLKTRTVGCSKMRVARTTWAHLKLLTRAAILRIFALPPNPIRKTNFAVS